MAQLILGEISVTELSSFSPNRFLSELTSP
jgi:hypothetical protein